MMALVDGGLGLGHGRERADRGPAARLRRDPEVEAELWGYKRAAAAVLALEQPIASLLGPDGTLQNIDGDPSRQDLDYDIARRAVAAGCLFALDSDAHSSRELGPYAETAIAHARLAGIPTNRIVNCWPLERLMKWARSRSG